MLHKGPGDAAFAVVADDIIVTTYNATGLAAGAQRCVRFFAEAAKCDADFPKTA